MNLNTANLVDDKNAGNIVDPSPPSSSGSNTISSGQNVTINVNGTCVDPQSTSIRTSTSHDDNRECEATMPSISSNHSGRTKQEEPNIVKETHGGKKISPDNHTIHDRLGKVEHAAVAVDHVPLDKERDGQEDMSIITDQINGSYDTKAGNNPSLLEESKSEAVETQKNGSLNLLNNTLNDTFPDMKKTKRNKHQGKHGSKKKKRLKKINVISFSNNDKISNECCNVRKEKKLSGRSQSYLNLLSANIHKGEDYSYRQCNDSLQFFSEMHEDQDPETIEIVSKISKQWVNSDLNKLTKQNEEAKKNLNQQLKKKWDEELQKFLVQVKTLKKHISEKQEKQRSSLIEQKRRSIMNKENEARNGMKYIIDNKLDAIHKKYHQQPWSKELEQRKTAELNEIPITSREHQKTFERKLQVYREAKEKEYNKNRVNLAKHHQRRKAELSLAIQKTQTKFVEKHKQHRIYKEQTQEETFQTLREEIMKNRSNLLHRSFEHNSSLRFSQDANQKAVSTIVSANDEKGSCSSENEDGAAVLRYKRRKTVFSKSYIPVTLYIEIQNEGLHLTWRNKGSKDDKELEHDFLPWGFRARQFLHSIACGEFPIYDKIDVEKYKDCGLQGAQLKCTIADMRTCNDTANFPGSEKMKDTEIKKLRGSISVLRKNMENETKAEIMCESATRKFSHEFQLSKQKLISLQSQTERFMRNQDGTFNVSNDTKMKLTAAFTRYEKEVSSAERRLNDSQQQLVITKKKKAETMQFLKSAMDKYKFADSLKKSTNVIKYDVRDIASTIATIKESILKRRSISTFSADKNSSTDDEGHLEKGKNITTVLRPTMSRMKRDFQGFLKRIPNEINSPSAEKTSKGDITQYDRIRAEELFLLSLHPPSSTLPTVPAADEAEAKPWAEPGYQLNLDLPKKYTRETILPVIRGNSIFRKMYSEYSSTQGRKASTLLTRQHYRNITGIGTKLSTMSTLTEMKDFTEEEILRGYELQVPKERHKSKAKRKDRILKTDDDTSINSTKKRRNQSMPSVSKQTDLYQEKQTEAINPALAKQLISTSPPTQPSYPSNSSPMNGIDDHYPPYNASHLKQQQQQQSTMFKPSTSSQISLPPPIQYHLQEAQFQSRSQYSLQQRMPPHLQYHQMPNNVQPYQRTSNQASESIDQTRKG